MKKLRIFIDIEFFIYAIYLSLLWFMAYDNTYQKVIFSFFCVGALLSCYEVFKIFGDFRDYLKDPWNYIDACRTAFLVMLALTFYDNGSDFSDYFLILSVISIIKGVSYFRVASHPRYMINLLNEVLRDILPFILIVTYSTVSYGFLLLAMNFN